MRYLGIDYGTKRVGLALSDEGGQMAFPHEVLPNDGDLLKKLVALVEKEKVEEIIIGHSLDREGEENALHESVKKLTLELTLELGLPIHLEPEQYTTQEAIRFQGKNEHTDASAAAIILNSYLNRTKHHD